VDSARREKRAVAATAGVAVRAMQPTRGKQSFFFLGKRETELIGPLLTRGHRVKPEKVVGEPQTKSPR
jgi:hypothetical protein